VVNVAWKQESEENKFELHGLALQLRDAGKGNKELYGSFADGSNSVRIVPVKTGIDVIENSKITEMKKLFRSEHYEHITLGFLTTTKHCDFDGKLKSVDFVFLRDEKDEHPVKVSVDFEKEKDSKFSKLPGAMIQLLKEYGVANQYGGGVGMKWKTETSLSDEERQIDFFEKPDPQHSYKLYHEQAVSFELDRYSSRGPELSVTENIQPGGKNYGDVYSVELRKSYSAEGFSGVHIEIMYQGQEEKQQERMFPHIGGYAYVSDEKYIKQVINNPKAAEFKEIVERNRELMNIKPSGTAQS